MHGAAEVPTEVRIVAFTSAHGCSIIDLIVSWNSFRLLYLRHMPSLFIVIVSWVFRYVVLGISLFIGVIDLIVRDLARLA